MADGIQALEFRAVVPTGEGGPWKAPRVEEALAALDEAGLEVESEVDPAAAAKGANGKHPIELDAPGGPHRLLLQPKGAWTLVTPAETIMERQHVGRAAGAEHHIAAVRALVAALDPYFGADRWADWAIPPEQRTKGRFKAAWGSPLMWFSADYLAEHTGGKPLKGFTGGTLEGLAGGQLLVAAPEWFGDKRDVTAVVEPWLAKAQRKR